MPEKLFLEYFYWSFGHLNFVLGQFLGTFSTVPEKLLVGAFFLKVRAPKCFVYRYFLTVPKSCYSKICSDVSVSEMVWWVSRKVTFDAARTLGSGTSFAVSVFFLGWLIFWVVGIILRALCITRKRFMPPRSTCFSNICTEVSGGRIFCGPVRRYLLTVPEQLFVVHLFWCFGHRKVLPRGIFWQCPKVLIPTFVRKSRSVICFRESVER